MLWRLGSILEPRMWTNIKAVSGNLLKCSEWAVQSKRSTYILRRTNPVRLTKLSACFPKKFKRREYYYELVEDTDFRKNSAVDIILTKDVSGIGMRGELVKMNMYRAYRDLLLPKLAVMPNSPEAQEIMKVVEEKTYSSKYSRIVENYLAGCAVKVIMSNDNPWTLQPWHIKYALRQIGILTNESCINVPKEISGPNLEIENRDFIIYITMNQSEKFPVRCRIFHWSTKDAYLNKKLFDMSSPSEILFPEEKEVIETLQKIEKDIKEKEKLGLIRQKKKVKKDKTYL